MFGYHVTGSTGTLFLYGIVVGALALLGLSLLLAGARRTSRRGHEARRGLIQSRRETAAVRQDRDDLIDQRETARANSASTPVTAWPTWPRPGGDRGGQRDRWHLFRPRAAAPRPPKRRTAIPSP